jgi:hypothetical protein
MANLTDQIVIALKGWNSTGTNSKHDPNFTAFRKLFKKGITAELNKIGASNIVFNYGHYYITGFFTVNEQAYYFSLSDVGHGGEATLMYRTAKHYTDWTGGSNNWLIIEKDMFLNSNIKRYI